MSLVKSISGIRGTIGGNVGENLTPIDAVKFASAYGTFLKNSLQKDKLTEQYNNERDETKRKEILQEILKITIKEKLYK